MSSLRFLSIAARRVSSFSVTKRGYAEVSDKLKLSMVLPHQVRRALNLRVITTSMTVTRRQSSLQQMSFK
jgi:hypothetical protein